MITNQFLSYKIKCKKIGIVNTFSVYNYFGFLLIAFIIKYFFCDILLCQKDLYAKDLSNLLNTYRFFGTSCLTIPTAYCKSEFYFVNDDSQTITFVSQNIWGNFAELSYAKFLNGKNSNNNLWNLKLRILEEDKIVPSGVWGVADFKESINSKLFYLVFSKTLDVFGLTLHAGFYKDPITTAKQNFYGIEKMVFPLVTVAAERIDDQTNIGIKVRAYPNISLEYARKIFSKTDQSSYYKVTYYSKY